MGWSSLNAGTNAGSSCLLMKIYVTPLSSHAPANPFIIIIIIIIIIISSALQSD